MSKDIAWTSVLTTHKELPWSLGLATRDEYGYAPIKHTGDISDPFYVAKGPTRFATITEADAEAKRLNEALGLEPLEALKIVASSMTRRGLTLT